MVRFLLKASLADGNRNDVTQLLPRLDKVSAAGRRHQPPQHRPDALPASPGYDRDK